MNSSTPPYHILRATPADADLLKAIGVAAKAHWPYPPEWIARWTQVFQVSQVYIAQHHVYKAQLDQTTIGWYGLIMQDDAALLDDLWVTPAWIGQGVGRSLFTHACQTARQHGSRQLRWEAEPYAVGFYQQMGATIIGEVTSSMGRALPLMALQLA
ncbi:MAG: GNAT family N-acetyltransferase [Caldilineaceae bacterium]|nr:GNAT family N-acetyltransferase [Caldilineaceae bacterium]